MLGVTILAKELLGAPAPLIFALIAGLVIFLIFVTAFIIELVSKNKNTDKIHVSAKRTKVERTSSNDLDIDAMLSKLEQKATITKITEEDIAKEKQTEETPVVQEKKESKEEDVDFESVFADLEKNSQTKEIAKVEKVEKVSEVKPVVEKKEEASTAKITKTETTTVTTTNSIAPKTETIVKVVEKPVYVGTEFDYKVRYEQLKDSISKSEKDLLKSTKEVNKYEKTERRKAKSVNLLEKKAGELTNLNLVLYNVNDIKEIDQEKKDKQKDLAEHIAKLKTTISEAEEYLSANNEKYKNALKIKEFLTKERERQESEIVELEALIVEADKKNKK